MKTHRLLSLLALVTLLGSTQSAFAASKKADENTAALVAALQAVSPDPLCGRLGLAATTARSADAVAPAATTSPRRVTVMNTTAERDRRAYLIWKSAQKS